MKKIGIPARIFAPLFAAIAALSLASCQSGSTDFHHSGDFGADMSSALNGASSMHVGSEYHPHNPPPVVVAPKVPTHSAHPAAVTVVKSPPYDPKAVAAQQAAAKKAADAKKAAAKAPANADDYKRIDSFFTPTMPHAP